MIVSDDSWPLCLYDNQSFYNSVKTQLRQNDKIQNDKMQKWQNTKRQNTNMTKCKTTKCKYDKMQKDRMPIRQNTKRQFTNMTKHKKTEHKSDNTQYDKIQIWQNTNATKYKYLLLKQYRGVTIENRRAAKWTATRSALLYGGLYWVKFGHKLSHWPKERL